MKRVWAGALAMSAVLAFSACGEDKDSSDTTPAPGTQTATTAPSGTTAPAAAGLDTAFGKDGILSAPLSADSDDRFMAVAVANDGSIFGAGFVDRGGDHAMAVAKFNAAGAPDKAFGTDGVAVVNVASGGKAAELARSIVLLPDGKIVIAGPVEHDPSATGDAAKDTDAAVVRLDASGNLDPTFGDGGIAVIDLGTGRATSATAFGGDNAWGMTAISGGRVAVFGSKLNEDPARTDADYVAFAVTNTGKLDTSFGKDGQLVVDLGKSGDSPRNITLLADGKVVATGYSRMGDVVQPVLIKFTAAGVLDNTWGEGGVATAKVLPGVGESYAVYPQGDSLISAGYGRGADATEKVDMIVDRWTKDGTWDTSFGNEGVARLDLAKEDDRGRNVIVLPDQRILVVGSGKKDAANVDGLIALFGKDGKLESSFGTAGSVLTDFGGPSDSWYGVALSPDKKSAIVVGYKGAGDSGNDDAVIAKVKF